MLVCYEIMFIYSSTFFLFCDGKKCSPIFTYSTFCFSKLHPDDTFKRLFFEILSRFFLLIIILYGQVENSLSFLLNNTYGL